MVDQRVTVVIPTKDRWPLLQRTLRSVLAQRDVELEVVVVDDGGSDGTTEELHSLRERRVHTVRHDRSEGVSHARNTGLDLVTTRWVAFLDDDDLWAPEKLAKQLRALSDDVTCRWACPAAVVFQPDGRVLDIRSSGVAADIAAEILVGNVIPGGGSGVLADAALVREVGGFDVSLSNLADWDLWVRLAQRSPIAWVETPDVAYRLHPTSMAHDVGRSERELTRMRLRYAECYERHGVEVDDAGWLWYLHGLAYSSGDWTAGVRRSLDLYRQHGHVSALLHPARLLVPASFRRRIRARQFAARAPQQLAYVESWLQPLIRSDAPSPAGGDDGAPSGG